MKETIEAWARVNASRVQVYACEEDAKRDALKVGGIVVRLTGEMPRVPRKVSTEVWIEPFEEVKNSNDFFSLIGIRAWSSGKTGLKNPIRARITMEELGDE